MTYRSILHVALATWFSMTAAACGDDDGEPGPTGGSGGNGAAAGSGGKSTGGSSGTGGRVTTGGAGGTGATSGAGAEGGVDGSSGADGEGGTAADGGVGGIGNFGGEGGIGDEPLDAGGRVIELTPERFFPEGVAVDKNGNFYIGSMELGSVHIATASDAESSPFIEPDAENELVSVIGLYVDDATDTLYVCSSDAGNSPQAGNAQAAIKAFSLPDGEFVASYEWPEYSGTHWTDEVPSGVNGFCNDMTMDADGNLYATDSWYPRILRLAAGDDALEEWVVDDIFHPTDDPWHLNGIDIDQSNDTLYVVENHPGTLFAVPIQGNGDAGTPVEVEVSPRALLSPDGLKLAAPNLLITAEGGNQGGGVSVLRMDGTEATLEEVISGFDQVATLALREASAWVVENQGDHFWGPADNGPDADPPFRLVEVPLEVGGGEGIIETATEGFFSEGVTVDADGNFYVGSMNLGLIHRVAADGTMTESFIEPDSENELVSVIGLYADSANDILYACSSDAGNSQQAGDAQAAIKAFSLSDGDFLGSFEWPVYDHPWVDLQDSGVPNGVNGFCNDMTMDADGNLYATDSWYPRILRLPAGGDTLEEWLVDPDTFPSEDPWHLNGIDIDRASNTLYVVENHPGAIYAVPILGNGSAGNAREITTQRPVYMPDGLKVIDDDLLLIAEGQTGGVATVEITGNSGYVRRISTGLDGIATFAMLDGNAWLVENQGDHFWGGDGMETKPFRLVEIPLNQ
jgi:sugar lactone lactonase YvrE